MKQIAKSTLIIAFFFAVDKVMGFARQLLIAREFQLSYQMDVFNAANNIPDLLSALISGGALAVALIPVISDFLETRGRHEAWKLFSHVLNLAFIITAVLAIAAFFLAPWLIANVIVPGFPPEQKKLTIELMRLDLIAIMIFSVSGLVMAGLQANQHFLLPALAPAMYDLGQFFGILVLAPSEGASIGGFELPAFGMGIHGLVYGVIFGAVLHLVIQIPGLIKYQFYWEPKINLKTTEMRQVLSLLGPRVITMFFIQAFFIIRDALASAMGEGAVTALNLGWFIMQVPETLLGTAIAIALLPSISSDFAVGKIQEFIFKINQSIKTILIFTIPSAVLLSIGIFPLAQLAFGFDSEGTQRVVYAAQIYLAGMVGHSLLEIASRAFYAKKNAIIPLIAAVFNATAYLLLSKLLSQWFGFGGIAWANSIVFTTESILLLIILNRQHGGIFAIRKGMAKLLISTACSAFILFAALQIIDFLPAFIVSLIGMSLSMVSILFLMRKEIQPILKMI